MTLKEVAKLLRVDRQTLRRANKSGNPIIPSIRYFGGKRDPYRYFKTDVEKFLEDNQSFQRDF